MDKFVNKNENSNKFLKFLRFNKNFERNKFFNFSF